MIEIENPGEGKYHYELIIFYIDHQVFKML